MKLGYIIFSYYPVFLYNIVLSVKLNTPTDTDSMPTATGRDANAQILGNGAPFECSHQLDSNALLALHHDDDEDRCFNGHLKRQNNNAFLEKQKYRQEQLRKFRPGEFFNFNPLNF